MRKAREGGTGRVLTLNKRQTSPLGAPEGEGGWGRTREDREGTPPESESDLSTWCACCST